MASQAQLSVGHVEVSLQHHLPSKPFPQYIDESVFEEIQDLLRTYPDLRNGWAERSRLYTLLRMLHYSHEDPVFKTFGNELLNGDFWLPLPPDSLNDVTSIGGHPISEDFFGTQLHILSRPHLINDDVVSNNFPPRYHRRFRNYTIYFEDGANIGTGASAHVVGVQHKESGKNFACKRFVRNAKIRVQRKQLELFAKEVSILRRVTHHHLVRLVMSFTDLNYFGLILEPVADYTLKTLLESHDSISQEDIDTLCQSFGCLATGLAALHQERVRHKDIKPGNILLYNKRVYFCDFGISHEWTQDQQATTMSGRHGLTAWYGPPEADISRDEPRNLMSDIWSLGRVYFEMFCVIKGHSLQDVNRFLHEHTIGQVCSQEAMTRWLDSMKSESERNDHVVELPAQWIALMIETERDGRPTAHMLVNEIHNRSDERDCTEVYFAPCCQRSRSSIHVERSIETRRFSTQHLHSDSSHRPQQSLRFSNVSTGSSATSRALSDLNIPSMSRGPSIDQTRTDDNTHVKQSMDSSRMHSAPSIPSSRPTITPSKISSESALGGPQATHDVPLHRPMSPPGSSGSRCICDLNDGEVEIFDRGFNRFKINLISSTAETTPDCIRPRNRVRIYEKRPRTPDDKRTTTSYPWHTTRRLIVCEESGPSESARCHSFWLPLADINFSLSNKTVGLRWSDCNQEQKGNSEDYAEHWNRIYDPRNPNNGVTITFEDTNKGSAEALEFLDVVRFFDKIGHTFNVSESQQLQFFNRVGKEEGSCRPVYLTDIAEPFSCSKLFVFWNNVDIHIEMPGTPTVSKTMSMMFNNITTPTYHSDMREEPARRENKIAKFHKAGLISTSFQVIFPFELGSKLCRPSNNAIEMLRNLTGWSLRFVAALKQVKSKKLFSKDAYGESTIMLWEQRVSNRGGIERVLARVTFRRREDDRRWITGAITASTRVSPKEGTNVTFTLSDKQRDRWLDMLSMTAIPDRKPNEEQPASNAQNTRNGTRTLMLTFQDPKHRRKFESTVEKLIEAVTGRAPTVRVGTASITSSR